MTEIDLTEAVTAAAREARARTLTRKEYRVITTLDAMEALNRNRANWDEAPLTEQNAWRESVVSVVYAAHQDVARQAWEQGRQDGHEAAADALLGTGEAVPVNPYQAA